VQLSELGDIFRPSVQPCETSLAARREALPADFTDAQGVEQARAQVAGEWHPGLFLNDSRQRVRARLVVGEDGTGQAVWRDEQEAPNGLAWVLLECPHPRFQVVAAGHRSDVADAYRATAGIDDVRVELREVRHDRVVQVQQTLGRGEGRSG